MKFILISVMAIAIIFGLYSMVGTKTLQGYKQVQVQQGTAQKATDAYRKSQEDMMKQLEQ
jgi:cell division protein FtsB